MSDAPHDHYGNYETMTVALTLENERFAHDQLIEQSIRKNYQLDANDIKAMLTDEPWKIFRTWSHDPFISRRKVNWDLIAKDFNADAREYRTDFRYVPDEELFAENKPDAVDAEQAEINASLAAIMPVLRELSYKDSADGHLVFLPQQQLPRKIYDATDRILQAFGGKWQRRLGAHVFEESPVERIREVIETGRFKKPYNFGYFPTQPELVESILDTLQVEPGMLMLEPEMGQGHIADVTQARYPDLVIHGFEINPKNHALVSDRYACVLGDFLEQEPQAVYDIVFMNPPFEKQQDIDHALHAMKFLKPGGQFACIMSGGVANNSDRKSQEFRDRIAELGGSITDNPDGAFKASGTMVSTVTVRFDDYLEPKVMLQAGRRVAMA